MSLEPVSIVMGAPAWFSLPGLHERAHLAVRSRNRRGDGRIVFGARRGHVRDRDRFDRRGFDLESGEVGLRQALRERLEQGQPLVEVLANHPVEPQPHVARDRIHAQVDVHAPRHPCPGPVRAEGVNLLGGAAALSEVDVRRDRRIGRARRDDLTARPQCLRVPHPAQLRADARARALVGVLGGGIEFEPRGPLVEVREAVQHREERRLRGRDGGRSLDADMAREQVRRHDRHNQQQAHRQHDPSDPVHGHPPRRPYPGRHHPEPTSVPPPAKGDRAETGPPQKLYRRPTVRCELRS